jgi:hypothetical protein
MAEPRSVVQLAVPRWLKISVSLLAGATPPDQLAAVENDVLDVLIQNLSAMEV